MADVFSQIYIQTVSDLVREIKLRLQDCHAILVSGRKLPAGRPLNFAAPFSVKRQGSVGLFRGLKFLDQVGIFLTRKIIPAW
ncbi:MAG: hypothetical protein IPH12_16025 [Saprospirales bacterium]|nr:hypothetical protein [Saprospirales bacterium]MBK8920096.1 hypothetical protein [Saprospirales bacterium]